MMAFPSMLVSAAEKAGMKVPPDPDNYDREEFPHFSVFCMVQLGRRMHPGEHWDNAKVVAELSDEEVTQVSIGDLVERGLSWST